jgi:hypothetical protein
MVMEIAIGNFRWVDNIAKATSQQGENIPSKINVLGDDLTKREAFSGPGA